ncbi:MAG: class I SAM-dependent methyltransferase [Pyrinomonadaceae bacterium]
MAKLCRYIFESVLTCNMCGADTSRAKVLGQRLNRSQGMCPKALPGITVSVLKCGDCGLIFSNPLPKPENIQDHYGAEPESYWNEDYFQVSPDYFREEIDTAKRLLGFEEGMTSLDIGSGIGKGIVAQRNAGFDAYGLEPSDTFRKAAIERMGVPEERIFGAMLEEAEFKENSFDFVTFGAVLEHLYDPSESIRRVLSWLRPSGVMHIEVPSADYLVNRIANAFYRFSGSSFVSNISPMHRPFHLYEFALESFTRHARDNRYEIAEHTHYVGPIYNIPAFAHGPLKKIMRWGKSGMQLTVWLRKTGDRNQ